MKSIKQIRENTDILLEKEDSESRKLTMLVRAGLFDAKKLPFLKRALEKNATEMTNAEKKVLLELLDSLMAEVLQSPAVYQKVKQNVSKKELSEAKSDYLTKFDPRFDKNAPEKDLPYVIVLKRKAIRVYPDNQKVGLYYSQALDRYISIPLTDMNVGSINEAVGEKTTVNEPKDTKVDKKKQKDAPQGLKPTMSKRDDEVSKRKDIIMKSSVHRLAQPGSKQTWKAAKKAVWASDAPLSAKIGTRVGMQIAKGFIGAKKALTGQTAVSKKRNEIIARRAKEKQSQAATEPKLPKPTVSGNNTVNEALPALAIPILGAATRLAAQKGISVAARAVAKRAARGLAKGAAKAAGAIASTALSGNDSDNTKQTKQDEPRKYLAPIEGGGSVKTSRPEKMSTDRSRQERERRSMYQPQKVMEDLKRIKESNLEESIMIGEDSVTINSTIAKKILNVYESVNEDNKKKIENMLSENTDSFKKIVKFAVRQ